MKCPHCEYETHYMDWEAPKDKGNGKGKWIEKEEGEFFKLPIEMKRNGGWGRQDPTKDVYGCPVCNKLFME